jgi:hypothetical protein
MTANEFLELPPASYEATIDAMSGDERLALATKIGDTLRRSAFAYGYVINRRPINGLTDRGHAKSVKHANTLIKEVRKAMGYSDPDAERLRI